MARDKSGDAGEAVRVVHRGDDRQLVLEGTVGAVHARALQEVARSLAAEGRPVCADLSRLGHLDCAAIQVLLALDETLRQQGQALTLESVPDGVARTFRNAGLAGLC